MARTELYPTDIPPNGSLDPFSVAVSADISNGNMFANDGKIVFSVINTDSSLSTDVTIQAVNDEAGRIEDIEIEIPAQEFYLISPLRPEWWNQMSGDDAGKVYIDYSLGNSNVLIIMFRLQL